MHVILQSFVLESNGFHQNSQKLTSNTKNEQTVNTVTKYSLFCSCSWNYWKVINTDDIVKAVITEEKFAKSQH